MRTKMMIIALALVVALTACGPRSNPIPTATATLAPTNTPQPSATPLPSPTPAPTLVSTPELLATLVTEAQPTLAAVATQVSGIDLSGFIKDAAVSMALEELNKLAAGRFTCQEGSWKGNAINLDCNLPTQQNSAAHQELHFIVIEALGKFALSDGRVDALVNADTSFTFTTGTTGSTQAYRSISSLDTVQRGASGDLNQANWAREAGFGAITR